MPGVNDSPEQGAPILELASAAGAAYVTGIALHLRGEVRDLFFEWLRAHRPDLIAVYESLYRGGAYMPVEERRRLARLVRGPDLRPGERLQGPVAGQRQAGGPAAAKHHAGESATAGHPSGAPLPQPGRQQRLF